MFIGVNQNQRERTSFVERSSNLWMERLN